MRCERFREASSARLDGEPLGVSATALHEHLDACPDCARWAESAARLTRLARVDATPVPDLAGSITAGIALPARRVLRRRHVLRWALAVVGVAQVGIGIPALAGDTMGMAMAVHASHEAAAWNIAIGVAFVAAAVVPRRASGLIPLLGVFTVVLTVLSIRDLAADAVSGARLATHAAIVLGLLLLVALDRAERALPTRSRTAAVPARADGERPGLRGVA